MLHQPERIFEIRGCIAGSGVAAVGTTHIVELIQLSADKRALGPLPRVTLQLGHTNGNRSPAPLGLALALH
jgi:hypothetical protein